MKLRTPLTVAAVALALVLIGGVAGRRGPAPAEATAPPVDRLTAGIARAQERLAAVPGDYGTWAALGVAYLEKARVSADPAYYPKAEGALRTSLSLRAEGNAAALAGLGAVANARHEFARARDWGLRAAAANPYSADAYAVLADAHTQLGAAAEATAAVQKMLDLKPGLPAYARASYDLEQRGMVAEARGLMEQALAAAVDPADVAFCRYQLGELAFHAGDLDTAAGWYVDSLEGRAKVAAARGDLTAATALYAELTARTPSPGYLLAYAEVLRVAGRPAEADAQLSLAGAAQTLFAANGGSDDLAGAALAIARGKPADAVLLASAEWSRRRHADVADLLAWSLHLAGRDAEALRYARQAGALGARNAVYAYHVGAIELALGDRVAARAHLRLALDINPYFSLVDAPLAARALAELGES